MLTRIFPSTPSIEGFPKFPFHPPEACCAPLQMSALFMYFMDFSIYWQKKSVWRVLLGDFFPALLSRLLSICGVQPAACSVNRDTWFSFGFHFSRESGDKMEQEMKVYRWEPRRWFNSSSTSPSRSDESDGEICKKELLFPPAKNIFKTDLPPCFYKFLRHQKRLKVVFPPIL